MATCKKSSFGDYIWLGYSIFFFFEPIARNNAHYWLKCGLLFAVFLAVYVSLVRAQNLRLQYLLLVAMTGLGLYGLSFNGGASCIFTFSAAFLPFVVEDTSVVIVCLVAQAIAVALEGWLLRLEWISVVIGLFLIAIVGSSNIFIGQKKRANARLNMAQDEIERLAALAERERIARDMHDVLGHTLSVIVLKAELARRLLEQETQNQNPQDQNPQEQSSQEQDSRAQQTSTIQTAMAEIADIEATARKALAEVRSAIVGYRSEGLAAELDLARRTLRSAGVALNLDTSLNPASLHLTATEETVLSLAVREAVTNIVRHASATTCVLRLGLTPDGFHSLLVEDDGPSQSGTPREGNGLRGMRERVQGLGGRFHVGAGGASLRGTTLLIELPTSPTLQQADR